MFGILIPQYLKSKYEKYSCAIVSDEDFTQKAPFVVSINKTPFEPHSLLATAEIEEKSIVDKEGIEGHAQLKAKGWVCIGN